MLLAPTRTDVPTSLTSSMAGPTMLRQISSHLCNNLQPNPVVGEGISTNLKGNVAIV